jgi:hypothetical protein
MADLIRRAWAFFAVAFLGVVLGFLTLYDKWVAPKLPESVRPTVDRAVSEWGPPAILLFVVLGVLKGYHDLRLSERDVRKDADEATRRIEALERQIHPEPTIEIDAAHGRATLKGKHSLGTVRAVTDWATESSSGATPQSQPLTTEASAAPESGPPAELPQPASEPSPEHGTEGH